LQKRVLIVDDSKFVRTTFKHILSSSFAVCEAADGEAAWRAIQSDPSIVIVFSDLDMPKLDGYGLIERIRKSTEARIRELPLIVFSGSENEEAQRRARTAGANDFISKSADAPEVLSRINMRLRTILGGPETPQSAVSAPLNVHQLIAQGRQQYSSARSRRTPLSVMALRVQNYAEVAQKLGRNLAEELMARIAKAIIAVAAGGNLVGRAAEAAFVVISPAGAQQMLTFARRLQEQFSNAHVRFGTEFLTIHSSTGLASLGIDTASSIEELIKLALQRAPHAAPAGVALTPAEQAILRQIGGLIQHSGANLHAVKDLTATWPPLHRDAYRGGYMGLVRKGFIAPSANGDAFSITQTGLKVLAVVR
jgi:two-component system, cell cycle response regulator